MEQTIGSSSPGFRDRSRGLAFYGWILIATGGLCALLAALLCLAMLAMAIGSMPSAPAMRPGGALFSVAIYLGLAAVLVALGVGSIRARRWARAFALILAWVWLATGALGLLAMGLIIPKLPAGSLGAGLPGGMFSCVMVFLVLFLLLFFVALPLLLLLFYRREDVRQTVERKDPTPAWTDRVRPSILGIVLALAVGAAASILSALAFRAVPLFGSVLTGGPAIATLVGFGLLSALLAVAVYRRARAGWWGLIALQVVGLAHVAALRRLDMEPLLRKMGYPEEQARLAGQLNLFGQPIFLALVGAAWVALMAFLLSVRKEFG